MKKTRNLPISSIIWTTYTRCNSFFKERGKQITTMISVGHVYSKNATKVLQDADLKLNTHMIVEFDRNTTKFRVEDMVLAACKHAHHDFKIYISPYYRLDVIMKVYNNMFGQLRHEEYWPPYQGTTSNHKKKCKGSTKIIQNQD
ncbi:hypothetical protein V8G54_001055 [Vigna mungo]|uniref:Uncharacterized protein n=1 Tax=Vigna mungo TaxID=3915 RepID=A0AAQ3P5Q3_VIGMU